MATLKQQYKIIDIVEHDSNLLPVINRFGIKLGFGELTVLQLCNEHKIDVNFFLSILNVYHNDSYFPEQKLLEFKLNDIVNYLVKSHQYYNEYIIPEIDRLLKNLLENNPQHKEIFIMLEKIFENFKYELSSHTDYEEKIIFKEILSLEAADYTVKLIPPPFNDLSFSNIHSQLDDKIIDIKNIMLKYLPPVDDVINCNAFTVAILNLEKDLKDHAKIEDRILYPKVSQILKNNFA
jgi:regulator of cell morphogenesis and NO signaling